MTSIPCEKNAELKGCLDGNNTPSPEVIWTNTPPRQIALF